MKVFLLVIVLGCTPMAQAKKGNGVSKNSACMATSPIEHFKRHALKPDEEKTKATQQDLNGDEEPEILLTASTPASPVTVIYQKLETECYRVIGDLQDEVVPIKTKKNGYTQLKGVQKPKQVFTFDPAKSEYQP